MLAQPLRLLGQGILRDGMKSGIVFLNSQTVRATTTFEDHKQHPVGIEHVLVNVQQQIPSRRHTRRALRRVWGMARRG